MSVKVIIVRDSSTLLRYLDVVDTLGPPVTRVLAETIVEMCRIDQHPGVRVNIRSVL